MSEIEKAIKSLRSLKAHTPPSEAAKIDLAIRSLEGVLTDLRECSEVLNQNKTLKSVFWMKDGRRTVASVVMGMVEE